MTIQPPEGAPEWTIESLPIESLQSELEEYEPIDDMVTEPYYEPFEPYNDMVTDTYDDDFFQYYYEYDRPEDLDEPGKCSNSIKPLVS